MFSNIFLRGKFRKAVRFFYKRETGGGLLPEELVTNKTSVTEETIETVIAKKHPPKKNLGRSIPT